MFKKQNDAQFQQLEEAIDLVFSEMKGYEANTDEYAALTKQLAGLMKLKEELNSGRRISPDALVGLASSLGGISLILIFERSGPILSKALSFVQKLR